METRRFVRGILVVLAGLTLLTMAFGASTSGTAFSPYNPDWQGGQELRSVATDDPAGSVWLRNASGYPLEEPADTVVVALSPGSPGAEGERRLSQFVREGGTLVVADDGDGQGNELLAAAGAGARIDTTPLRDEHRNGPSGAFPIAGNVTGHELTRGVDAVTLNYAGTVEAGGADVLIRSSEFSYRDRNGNERLDANEDLRRYPVASVEAVGDGRVVAISDSSLFINSMMDRTDNRAFARSLVGGGSRVVIDTASGTAVPPLAAVTITLRRSPLVQVATATAGLFVLFFAVRRPEWVRDRLGRLPGLRSPDYSIALDAASGPPTAGTRKIGADSERSPADQHANRPPPASPGGDSDENTRLRRVTEAIITRSEIRDYDD